MNQPHEQVPPTVEEDLAASVKAATFSTVMRGYDKLEVDRFLASLAERLDGVEAPAKEDAWTSGVVKRELERVGDSTKSILAAAEEAARRLREETASEVEQIRNAATEHAEKLRREAEEFAAQTRESVDAEARKLRLDASRQAEEAVAAGEARAEELIESAVRRRRVLEARIERLLARRDRVVDHLARLSEQLSAMAAAVREDDAEALGAEDHPEGAAEEAEQASDDAYAEVAAPSEDESATGPYDGEEEFDEANEVSGDADADSEPVTEDEFEAEPSPPDELGPEPEAADAAGPTLRFRHPGRIRH